MRVRSHGWIEPDDLLYAVVSERAEAPLARLFETGTLELQLPGSTKLILARSVGSVLETVDNLYVRYNLIIPSICPAVLFVRSDWQSAYLNILELQAAAPAVCHTSGWPYFSGVGPLELTPADCYIACVLTFLQLLAPGSFEKLRETGTKRGGKLTPLLFAHAMLTDKSWGESEGVSSRELLLKALPTSGAAAVNSAEWLPLVRRAFAVLASTTAHASSALDLESRFGVRETGEVCELETLAAEAPAAGLEDSHA
jgi:hypothetical protein